MKLREIMSNSVIKVHPEETVAVAARMLEHYNIGVLPVCDREGKLCGVVTDRDLVTRCLAAGGKPFQNDGVQTGTGGVQSGGVSAGASADNQHIIDVGHRDPPYFAMVSSIKASMAALDSGATMEPSACPPRYRIRVGMTSICSSEAS